MAFTVTGGGYDPRYGNYTMYVDVSTGRSELRIGGSATWTINNPGAITPGSFATGTGATSVFQNNCPRCTDLATYPDYVTGRAAQAQLLLSSTYNNGDISIIDMVRRWPPPESNPNWQTYARNIAEALGGVSPDTTVNKIRQLGKFDQLLSVQQEQEGWHPGTVMKFEGDRLVETIGPDGIVTQWDHPLLAPVDSLSRLLSSGFPVSLPPVSDLSKLSFANLMLDIDKTLHLPAAPSVTPFLIPKTLLQGLFELYRQSIAVTAPAQFPSGWSFNPTVLATLPDGSTYTLYIAACTGSCHDCPPNSTFQFDYYINMFISHGPAVLAGGIWSQSQGVASFHPYRYEQPNTISDLAVPQTPSGTPDQLAAGYISEFVQNAYAYGQAHGWNHATAQELAQTQALLPSVGGGTTYPWPTGTGDIPASVTDAAADSRWGTIAPVVARQVAAALGLPIADTGPAPTLLVNLDAGPPPSSGGSPFLNSAWAGPGDALFVWDPSKLRSLVADAPGETVVGFGMDATLDGRPGNDALWAGPGDNTLLGGPGDVLHGGSGTNVFAGGPNNLMYAGSGTNIFQLARGFGTDTIYASDAGIDTVRFGPGIDPEDVRVVPRGWTNDLVLEIPTSGDRLTLKGWYETLAAGGPQAVVDSFQEHPEWGTRVQQVVFADGTVWDEKTLRKKSLAADAPNEPIVGFNTDETLIGRRRHDELWAGAGSDTLIGGPQALLHGGSGHDVFESGRDNVIVAGSGTNAVEYRRGDGQDILDPGAGGATTVALGNGEIKPLDVVFALQLNATGRHDLLVSIHEPGDDSERDDRGRHGGNGNDRHPSTDSITVLSWDAAGFPRSPVSTFETKHARLMGADVGPLIQAMATFTADTGLSWEQAIEQRPGSVKQILAQYWQPIALSEEQRDGGDHGDHGHGWSR